MMILKNAKSLIYSALAFCCQLPDELEADIYRHPAAVHIGNVC